VLDLQTFLAADGSQFELRALAELSRDELMIRLYQEAAKDRRNPLKDFHCQNGHLLMGWPVERIAKDKKARRVCKNSVFGICFGLTEENLHPYVVAKIRAVDGAKADLSDITVPRIRKIHRKFFQTYTGVARYQVDMRRMVEETGYAETLFGFRREIFEDSSRGSYTGNQAINTPVQGTAHGFMLIAMALLQKKPRTYRLLQECLMEIHDALYFRLQLRHLVEGYKQLIGLFEEDTFNYAQKHFHLKLRVPLLVEASAGFTKSSMIEDYQGEPLEEFLLAWRAKEREIEMKSWEDLMPMGSN
jgi:DNA polymerase I-like protein with 3'-5' exonuclease and polymerase domains